MHLNIGQPNHLNTEQMDAILLSYVPKYTFCIHSPVFYWLDLAAIINLGYYPGLQVICYSDSRFL